jgi:hypothetical protein
MRVRKSVPEGYKTGSNYSGFTLYSDSHSPTTVSNTQTSPTLPLQRKGPRPRARELTPFCGILKVGGMAGQQWGIYNPSSRYNEEVMDEEDEEEEEEMGLPGLTSSQESATSTSSGDFGRRTPMGTKRRFFEDEDEVGDERGGEEMLRERVLAVPRRKKWAGMVGKGQGQENVNMGGGVGVVGQDIDFGEADFLDYGLVMDGEVEMGGV